MAAVIQIRSIFLIILLLKLASDMMMMMMTSYTNELLIDINVMMVMCCRYTRDGFRECDIFSRCRPLHHAGLQHGTPSSMYM